MVTDDGLVERTEECIKIPPMLLPVFREEEATGNAPYDATFRQNSLTTCYKYNSLAE